MFSQNEYSMKFENENYLEVNASQFEDDNGFIYMAWVKLIEVTGQNSVIYIQIMCQDHPQEFWFWGS